MPCDCRLCTRCCSRFSIAAHKCTMGHDTSALGTSLARAICPTVGTGLPVTLTASARATHTHYNDLMNLKLLLLIRMTAMGLLCWLAVSVYVVGQAGRSAAQDIAGVANQLQPMVAADVMRRSASLDSDARQPDLGGAAARFPEPMCLR